MKKKVTNRGSLYKDKHLLAPPALRTAPSQVKLQQVALWTRQWFLSVVRSVLIFSLSQLSVGRGQRLLSGGVSKFSQSQTSESSDEPADVSDLPRL